MPKSSGARAPGGPIVFSLSVGFAQIVPQPTNQSVVVVEGEGQCAVNEEQLLSYMYSDIYKFFSSMAPSLDDRLLAGERG